MAGPIQYPSVNDDTTGYPANGVAQTKACVRCNVEVRTRKPRIASAEGSIGLLFEFNLEAWIRFDVVNDLVVATQKIRDRDPTSVGAELAQLIEIERNELLNLEHLDSVPQAGTVR
jgi:hypothetical protein